MELSIWLWEVFRKYLNWPEVPGLRQSWEPSMWTVCCGCSCQRGSQTWKDTSVDDDTILIFPVCWSKRTPQPQTGRLAADVCVQSGRRQKAGHDTATGGKPLGAFQRGDKKPPQKALHQPHWLALSEMPFTEGGTSLHSGKRRFWSLWLQLQPKSVSP